MSWDLKGKTSVITGGTKGIGKAIVSEFVSLGASVLAVSRNQENLDELIKEFPHANISTFAADLSNPVSRSILVDYIIDSYQSIDILVNNVGTNIRKPTVSYNDYEFEQLFETNYKSVYVLSKSLYPLLKNSGSASIINISSIAAGRVVSTGSIYSSSKAALSQLTRYLAVEWAESGIRCNAIEPWYIDTPLVQSVLEDKEKLAKIIERTPMQRIGKAEEIAALAAFLAMDRSSYITGQVIQADGGASCKLL